MILNVVSIVEKLFSLSDHIVAKQNEFKKEEFF